MKTRTVQHTSTVVNHDTVTMSVYTVIIAAHCSVIRMTIIRRNSFIFLFGFYVFLDFFYLIFLNYHHHLPQSSRTANNQIGLRIMNYFFGRLIRLRDFPNGSPKTSYSNFLGGRFSRADLLGGGSVISLYFSKLLSRSSMVGAE